MKLANVNFGISAVQAGQKTATVNAKPQITACSTSGKFVITSPVSKALNVPAGGNVMFLNNIAGVEAAVQQRIPEIVAYAEENGIDINTPKGEAELVKALTQWYIAKGVEMFDSKGNAVMVSDRYTKEDKQKYLDTNRMKIVAENREALVEQFGEMSDDDLAERLTIDMVESPKHQLLSGSKTATTSNVTGIGCQLNFTDTVIWNTLKSDLDDPTSKNRVYDVKLDEVEKHSFNNGYQNVEILVYPFEFVEDAEPVVRGK